MRSTKQVTICFIFCIFMVACQKTGQLKSDDTNIKAHEQASELNARLCRAYLKVKKYERAMQKCQKSLRQNPKNVNAHKWIAILYQTLGQHRFADKHFKKAVMLAPGDSEARNNHGVFLLNKREYQQAEKEFLAAASNPLYGARELAFSNAGLSMLRAGDKRKAENYFRRALQINKFHPPALYNLAKIKFTNGNYLAAQALISRWSTNNNWTAPALWLAIQIAGKQGDQGRVASLGLLLKNQFPDSKEAQLYVNNRHN